MTAHGPGHKPAERRTLGQHVARVWDLWGWPVLESILKVGVVVLFSLGIILGLVYFFI